MPPDPTSLLVASLRTWARDQPAHVHAAVDLLINHDSWLRQQDFTGKCVHLGQRQSWIDWSAARRFAGETRSASTIQLAILNLAVAIAEDHYWLSIMGPAYSRWIADAVAQAVGVSA